MVLFLAVPPLWEEPPTAFSAVISHPSSVVEDVCLSLWQMFRLYCTCTIVICHCFSHQLLVNLLPTVNTTLQSILHWFLIFFFYSWTGGSGCTKTAKPGSWNDNPLVLKAITTSCTFWCILSLCVKTYFAMLGKYTFLAPFLQPNTYPLLFLLGRLPIILICLQNEPYPPRQHFPSLLYMLHQHNWVSF